MTGTLNKEEYTKLLAETMPRVIDSEAEHKRLLNEVEKLMTFGENLTADQAEVLAVLVTLIEQYEDKHYQQKYATPHEILKELMLARGLKEKDLLELLGAKGITSEVINGQRSISNSQAKALGEFFHLSPALFM